MMLFKNFKTMRTKAFFIIVILISTLGFSQQDPQYTQYMYNNKIINPAYAGSRGILSFGLLGRSQWVNINGAPNTVSFTVNSPMGKTENMFISQDALSHRAKMNRLASLGQWAQELEDE